MKQPYAICSGQDVVAIHIFDETELPERNDRLQQCGGGNFDFVKVDVELSCPYCHERNAQINGREHHDDHTALFRIICPDCQSAFYVIEAVLFDVIEMGMIVEK